MNDPKLPKENTRLNTYRNYVRDAVSTECSYEPVIGRIVLDPSNLRLLHAVTGILTEAGELADPIKAHIFYGKPLDKVNLKEEAGDLLWYVALLAEYLGLSDLTPILRTNIEKLRRRYPNKFTEHHAITRDLPAERVVLEAGQYPETEPTMSNGNTEHRPENPSE